mgnify:FL=1|tara:strand:+ start:576 stop:857 length:282 start_codon:yes stop_codon:yes gene_type:complete
MVQKGGQPPLFGLTAAAMETAASIFPSGPAPLVLLGGGKKRRKKTRKRSKRKSNKFKRSRRKSLKQMRGALKKFKRTPSGHKFKKNGKRRNKI